MEFSVGDKVMHPQFGPGRITGIEGQESSDGDRRHYVIEIPRQGLTVHTPVGKAGALGIRPAMSPSRSRRIMQILGGRARALPEGYKARQEQISARLGTGRELQLAGVVRDLSWRQKRSHLTKKDSDLLRQGLDQLSAEMALVSGGTVSAARQLIGAALTAAMTSAAV